MSNLIFQMIIFAIVLAVFSIYAVIMLIAMRRYRRIRFWDWRFGLLSTVAGLFTFGPLMALGSGFHFMPFDIIMGGVAGFAGWGAGSLRLATKERRRNRVRPIV